MFGPAAKTGSKRQLFPRVAPLLVLALACSASAFATWCVATAVHARDRGRFRGAMRWTIDNIEERLNIYYGILTGGAAFFGLNEHPTALQFRAYAECLNLREQYPGIQGFGFARSLRNWELVGGAAQPEVASVAQIPGEPSDHFPVTYLEPGDQRNTAALGYDMFSEPVRRAAMIRARDQGRAAASGRVVLLPEVAPPTGAGFLIYMPVFRGGKVPPGIEERREKLAGFVYSAFRANDLFGGIFSGDVQPSLHFEVYDGTEVHPAALLHRCALAASQHPQFSETRRLTVAGQPWTLLLQTTPGFEAASNRSLAWWVLGIGLVLSVALAGIADALAGARLRAEQMRDRVSRQTSLQAELGVALAVQNVSEEDLMKKATDALVRCLPAAFARIWTLNPATDMLELQASSGLYTHLDGPHSRVRLGHLKIGLIAQQRKPHLTNDVLRDPRISSPAWARENGMVAFAGYPLLVEDQLLGVLALFAREPLPPDTLENLGSVSDLVAQGIQRKRAERELCHAQAELRDYAENLEQTVAERTARLRESVTELEAFSYSLSHDMRGPLRSIQSFAQLVLEDCGPAVGDAGREYLNRVVTSAQRLDRLISDVLAYSRVSREEIKLEPVNIDKLVRDIIHERRELQEPNAEVEIEGALLPVLGSEASLTQCVTNLLGNAVKFVARGVRAHVRVRCEPVDNQVRLWVEDNGIGIEPDWQQRIFDIFQRSHQGCEYEGTGIGLAIVRKAVERMCGQVGVESQPGKGSRFWLQLPGTNQ